MREYAYFRCSCLDPEIYLYVSPPDPRFPDDRELFVHLGRYKMNGPERVKLAWKILRKGKLMYADVHLGKDDSVQLRDTLIRYVDQLLDGPAPLNPSIANPDKS